EFILLLSRSESRSFALDYESRSAVVAFAAIGDGHYDVCVRVSSVRRKILRSVELPETAVSAGRRAHARRIRPRTRFGERPRAEMLAPRKRRNVFFNLFLRTALVNMIRAERIVRSHSESNRSVDACNLFDYRRVCNITQTRTAELFGEDDTHQVQLG